jgi:hypothetical protein
MKKIHILLVGLLLIPFGLLANTSETQPMPMPVDSSEMLFEKFGDTDFNVYPNTDYNSVNLQFNLKRDAVLDCMIYNDKGDLVSHIPVGHKSMGPRQIVVPVNDLKNGNYKIQLHSEGVNLTEWVEIQR